MKLLKNKPFGKREQIADTPIPATAKLLEPDTGRRAVAFCFEATDGYFYTVSLTWDDLAILDQAYHS